MVRAFGKYGSSASSFTVLKVALDLDFYGLLAFSNRFPYHHNRTLSLIEFNVFAQRFIITLYCFNTKNERRPC